MVDTKNTVLRLPPELAVEITKRAKEKGISQNEWMIRAMRYAILHKGGKLRHVEVYEL